MSATFWGSAFFTGDGVLRIAPSPPPQPSLDRLAAEADQADARYTAMRERAVRAEEALLVAEARVRALEEAQGELLDTIHDGDYPICPRCHDRLMCCGCWWPHEERP